MLVRHEQAAVHAAQGYARSTCRLGVVLVTSGPGMANTTSGLLDALSDSIPILCLSGQAATTSSGTNAFQECDALSISRSVTKWNVQVRSVGDITSTVHRAIRHATQGRPGPVLVDVPKDIQAQPHPMSPASVSALREDLAPPPLGDTSLEQAAALVAASRRPVFYGGGGLVNSGDAACARFAALVRSKNAPCTLTLMGLGAFPASSPNWLGMLGMHGTVEANLAMHDADLIVCVGARFDDRVTGTLDHFCPDARIIHIDVDPASIGKVVRTDIGLAGDCNAVLTALQYKLDALKIDPARVAHWWQRIQGWRDQQCLRFASIAPHIAPQQLTTTLATALSGKDAIVSTDVGQHQMWAAQYIPFERPRRWLTSGGAGTMGYGLPAGIGAQNSRRPSRSVCRPTDRFCSTSLSCQRKTAFR